MLVKLAAPAGSGAKQVLGRRHVSLGSIGHCPYQMVDGVQDVLRVERNVSDMCYAVRAGLKTLFVPPVQ